MSGVRARRSLVVRRPDHAGSSSISGHESKKILEVYQHLSLDTVEDAYQEAVQKIGL